VALGGPSTDPGTDPSTDPSTDPGTVLVLRALGLGDALVGVPALRGLRRRYPAARLVLAGPEAVCGWLRGLGLADAVLPVAGLAPLAPDALVRAAAAHPRVLTGPVGLAVNLHGSGPQSTEALLSLHPGRVLAFAGPLTPDGPAWDPDEHDVDRWVRLVAEVGAPCRREDLVLTDAGPARGRTVVVHPGAASGARRWPAARWAQVVGALASRGLPVVVTGGPGERALCAEVAAGSGSGAGSGGSATDLSGALDLPALADLVGHAGLLLCGDTGVAHLATATRTPSVLLFGPSRPQQWGPLVDLDRHAVLWPAPAGYRGDQHADTVDPVLAAVSVDDVLREAGALLAPPAPATATPLPRSPRRGP
jgi:ADP-heptose:LPS heptosyltransferase